jgi:protein associated with RNAse G/E
MKSQPSIDSNIPVHSYKHNGKIHRVWNQVRVMDVTDNIIITASNKTLVIESDGRIWKTTEPAVSYFFNDLWFNVIAILRADGVHFYCNLSSPCVYDEGALKYIDYDLDLKVFPNYRYKVLDEYEFNKHRHEMDYPDDIQKIVRAQMRALIDMVNKKEGPFKPGFAKYWYDLYRRLK